ncbi:MAG: hypothetical protein N2Z72_05765 [Bacteroidales bacterium]|nr:hypothetical protein [Bacteroidales bacterium]
MKRVILFISFLNAFIAWGQNVGISDNPIIPDPSAMLEIQASSKGLLIPRVSLTQTSSPSPITAPAISLLVYNTATVNDVTPGYYYWDGIKWIRVMDANSTTPGWLLTGNVANASNFIGTTNPVDFRIYTDNTERMRVSSNGNVGIGTTTPTEKLHVSTNLNAHKSAVFGFATQTSTTTDFRSVGVLGSAVGANSTWGYAVGVLGVADKTNSWRAVGVYATLDPNLPTLFTTCALYANGNNIAPSGIFMGGNVGINTTYPSYTLHVQGKARVDTFLLVGNPSTSAITRRGMKTFYLTSTLSVQNGYAQSASLGTLDVPTGASSFTVTKVVYAINGYHQDGDEQHGVMVRIGSTDFGSIYETANNGYVAVDWINTSSHSNVFTSSQNVYFRIYDASDLIDDYFYILNGFITIYYEYSLAPQRGDIVASGRVYSREIYSMSEYGDLAEHYQVIAPANFAIEPGMLVSFIPGSNANFTLATWENVYHLAGVISENPTFVLNNPSQGYPIAFVGRVKVKLVPSSELIRSGDFLTVSDVPGLAQKASKPGPIIGYAITNQNPGESFVEILLQPGRYIDHIPENSPKKPGKVIEK